jgi:hypothetical protein
LRRERRWPKHPAMVNHGPWTTSENFNVLQHRALMPAESQERSIERRSASDRRPFPSGYRWRTNVSARQSIATDRPPPKLSSRLHRAACRAPEDERNQRECKAGTAGLGSCACADGSGSDVGVCCLPLGGRPRRDSGADARSKYVCACWTPTTAPLSLCRNNPAVRRFGSRIDGGVR